MTRFLYLFPLLFMFFSCGASDKGEFKYFRKDPEVFSSMINSASRRSQASTMKEVMVYNSNYPFYFWLYDNNSFRYDLPNLKKGEGKWQIKNNQLYLFAKLGLFDLDVRIVNLSNNRFVFKFDDRFGPQVYDVEIGHE